MRLRGKWDGVELVKNGKSSEIWLAEHKTKSQIDGDKIARQLHFDAQTMLYLTALKIEREDCKSNHKIWEGAADPPLSGVRYNVVRRSAHKSTESMLKKIQEDQSDGRIGEWFAAWDVRVLPGDIETFRRECLDPLLENCLDDYEWWAYFLKTAARKVPVNVFDGEQRQIVFPCHTSRHFRAPYGIYDPIKEGGFSDLDEHLRTGSLVGLKRATSLFPELEESCQR